MVETARAVPSPVDVKVRVCLPSRACNFIDLGDVYVKAIARVREDVAVRFEESKNCRFFPHLAPQQLPERTEDVPAVREREIIALQLKDPHAVDGLEAICSLVMPQLECNVYRSRVVVDKVYLYRNLVSKRSAQLSWLWHYDNHPNEILKVMIYLTDVDEGSGPFEYLRSATGVAIALRPRPLCGHSRLPPSFVQRQVVQGCSAQRVTGPAGTLILFDNNVAHKANIPGKGHRDVVVFQVRPSDFEARSYVDPHWTGSFEHEDFSRDPRQYVPRAKVGA